MQTNKLQNLAVNLPRIMANSINDTVIGARVAVQKEIEDSFDRPTPFIKRGVMFEKATPAKLSGSVYLTGSEQGSKIASILRPHISGGIRNIKASERRLRRFGFMGDDQYLVPGPGAPLDRYGNISGANMTRILSQIQAFSEAGYTANAKIRGMTWKRYKQLGSLYVITRVGVFSYQGKGRQGVPILFFARQPQYGSGRFLFHETIIKYVKENWAQNFTANYKAGLK